MINEEEKFNDLLKSKLDEREFFFDELNWDKAEQMIVREEKRKKRRRFILIFLGGFILGAAIMFPIASILTSNNKQNSSTTSSSTKADDGDKNVSLANNNVSAPTNSVINNSNSGQDPANTTTAELTGKQNPADSISGRNKKSVKKKTKPADNPDAYAYVRPASERKHKKPVENPYIDELPDNLKPKNSNDNSSSNNNQSQPPANGSASQNANSKNNGIAASNAKQENVEANAANNNNQTSNNSSQAQTDSNKLKALAPVNDSSHNKNFVTQDNQATNVPQPKFKPSTTLTIDAGTGYSLGWKNETSNGGKGFSPVLGVRLNHSFTKHVALDAGLMYYGITDLYCPYERAIVSYSFGYNTTTITVSPQIINYIALPFEFQYHFNRNNCITIGGTLLYMVNAASKVISTTQIQLETPSSTKVLSFNYMDSFNPFDAQLIVAYRRKLFGRFGASIEAYYGLFDVENNKFFYSNTFERNSGLRLVLSYDIIK